MKSIEPIITIKCVTKIPPQKKNLQHFFDTAALKNSHLRLKI